MTELITENTAETLREKGWANVNKKGFSLIVYQNDFDGDDWASICENAGVSYTSNSFLQVLCIASLGEEDADEVKDHFNLHN